MQSFCMILKEKLYVVGNICKRTCELPLSCSKAHVLQLSVGALGTFPSLQ